MFDKIKRFFSGPEEEEEFIPLDLGREVKRSKVLVRSFILRSFEDVSDILNALREGRTIAVIDIKEIKTKDVLELKRAIAKIKKTVDAIEGSIAGFGEHLVIATPSFAKIYKPIKTKKEEKTEEE